MEPFKVPTIKAKYAKKICFGGHFQTKHKGVTNWKAIAEQNSEYITCLQSKEM